MSKNRELDLSDIEVTDTPNLADEVPPDIAIDEQALQKELELEKRFGKQPLEAAAVSAAGAASFSLSDRLLKKLGIYKEEELRELQARNPEADIAGAITGSVLPTLVGVPSGPLAAARAGTAAERAIVASQRTLARTAAKEAQLAEKIVESAVKSSARGANKKFVNDVIKKSVEKGVGSAVEGAALGTGQLLREEALGNADFNAENLLAAAGLGAVTGGLLGAGAAPIGAGLSATARQSKKLFGKTLDSTFDAAKSAEELTGLTSAQLARMRANPAGKQLLNDLPDWYKNTVGLKVTDSTEAIVQKVEQTAQKFGSQIDSIIDRVDEAAKKKFSTISSRLNNNVLKGQIYKDIADSIDQDFIKPFEGQRAFAKYTQQARNIVDDLREKIIRDRSFLRKPVSVSELREYKQKMDILAKELYDKGNKTMAAEAAFRARDLANKAILRYAEGVEPALAKELAEANRNYHYASTVLKPLRRKAESKKDFVSFKDLVFGGIGYGIGDTLGLTVAAGKKFFDSDLRRKMVVLSNVERANKQAINKVQTSVKNFLSNARNPARIASTSALINSNLAESRGERKKAKNKQEAFANYSERLQRFINDPEKMTREISRATLALGDAAPETSVMASEKMARALQFLNSKLPKPRYEVDIFGKGSKYIPSSLELAKFERYVQAVESPLSVLDDLQAGTLTREHVEALQAVYPNLYERIRHQAMYEITNGEVQLPYNRKIQLGILLNIPADSSLTGANISALQQAFTNPEPSPQTPGQPMVKPTAGGASKIDRNDRVSSSVSDIERGDVD